MQSHTDIVTHTGLSADVTVHTCCLQTGFRPVEAAEVAPANARAWWLLRTVTAHGKAVAGVAVHPSKPIAVTASDDHTWRMWHLPSCEQIMTGEGHTGWVAGLDFHPQVR